MSTVAAYTAPTFGARLKSFLTTTRLFYTQALSVELTYRFSLVQSFVAVGISWVGLVLFWLAAGKSSNGFYSQEMLLLYFLYGSAHNIVQESRVSWNLSAGIRMGKLAASLLRPFPFLVSVVCQAASFATVRFVILTLLFGILMLVSANLRAVALGIPAEAWQAYAVALLLSLAIGWLTRIGIGLLAFDMTQTWGPELVFVSFYVAASGVSYPPDLLSAGLHTIVTWTPVYYMIGFPSLVLLGRIDGSEFLTQLTRGGIVFAISFAVVALMWRRGMKKFEAVGI